MTIDTPCRRPSKLSANSSLGHPHGLAPCEPSSRSDEDLLELVAERRDEAAFDELYGRYGRAVCAVVVRLVGDRAGSEDVVQQAFTNVWRAAPGYRRERGPATSWLFAIARNAAVDPLRPLRLRRPSASMRRSDVGAGPVIRQIGFLPAARGRA